MSRHAELPRSITRAVLVELANAVEHRHAIPAFLAMPNYIITKVAVGRFRKALMRWRFRLDAEPDVLRLGQVLAMDEAACRCGVLGWLTADRLGFSRQDTQAGWCHARTGDKTNCGG